MADNYGDNSMAILSEVQFFGVGTLKNLAIVIRTQSKTSLFDFT